MMPSFIGQHHHPLSRSAIRVDFLRDKKLRRFRLPKAEETLRAVRCVNAMRAGCVHVFERAKNVCRGLQRVSRRPFHPELPWASLIADCRAAPCGFKRNNLSRVENRRSVVSSGEAHRIAKANLCKLLRGQAGLVRSKDNPVRTAAVGRATPVEDVKRACGFPWN